MVAKEKKDGSEIPINAKNGNCIINPAVLLRCRYNKGMAMIISNRKEASARAKEYPDDTVKFLFYWLMENPGFSEFT